MKNGKKNGGKKGKSGGGGDKPADQIIEFTPEGGFDIRSAARNFSTLMEQSRQPLVIHLPHVSVEFEPGCTPKEIIDGYTQALHSQFVVQPSNANTKGPK